jgi:hypothetical protein
MVALRLPHVVLGGLRPPRQTLCSLVASPHGSAP